MHDAILFKFPKLLGQHPFAHTGNLPPQFGEAMCAVVGQVKQDHDLPLSADYIQRGLDRAVVVRHGFVAGHTYLHVSTSLFSAYLAAE